MPLDTMSLSFRRNMTEKEFYCSKQNIWSVNQPFKHRRPFYPRELRLVTRELPCGTSYRTVLGRIVVIEDEGNFSHFFWDCVTPWETSSLFFPPHLR